MEEIVYWLWLSLACSPASTTFGKLIKEYSGAREIYEADDKRLSSIIGYRNSDRTALMNKNLDRANEIFSFCKKHHVGILTYVDDAFPNSLKAISDPPVLLYYRGTLPNFNSNLFVGAVGTRRLSDYGRKNAFKIGYDLAKAGAIVVSGMAEGIDGVTMAGAIAAEGTTVAVIGSGINVCYPPQHQTLARQIVKNGCVLTEYAPDTKPMGRNFPKRNRLISGLSAAVVVFEGPEKSGALITARCAKEQGKSVFALPGNVESKNSFAPNLLIKDGANICTRAEDLLNKFLDIYPSKINLFALRDRMDANMMDVLTELRVSATCPGDEIFSTYWSAKRVNSARQEISVENEPVEQAEPGNEFDRTTIDIYRRIPPKEGCSIESLVDEEVSLKDLMRHLLKLEISGFVVMLPGEMVARKFK